MDICLLKILIYFLLSPSTLLAENIITSQSAQIPIMQQLKAKFEKEKPSNKADLEKYIKEYDKVKDTMFKEMKSLLKTL